MDKDLMNKKNTKALLYQIMKITIKFYKYLYRDL